MYILYRYTFVFLKFSIINFVFVLSCHMIGIIFIIVKMPTDIIAGFQSMCGKGVWGEGLVNQEPIALPSKINGFTVLHCVGSLILIVHLLFKIQPVGSLISIMLSCQTLLAHERVKPDAHVLINESTCSQLD